MTDITQILSDIEQGDASAADQLLPLIYDELRKLAAARMAREKPGQTIQATALVHEAYLRLMKDEEVNHWNSRGHFFAAAGEAMRRILVERARTRQRRKHGQGLNRIDVNDLDPADQSNSELILALDEALEILAAEDERLASVVKLRCFAGFSMQEVAESMGLKQSTGYKYWSYAKTRIRILMDEPPSD